MVTTLTPEEKLTDCHSMIAKLRAQTEALAERIFELSPDEKREALDAVDPDWTDHWHDWYEAFTQYWQDDTTRGDMIEALVEGYK